MAKPSHLEYLAKGRDFWNRWRSKNPDIKPDLSGARLAGENLSEFNFQETNLQDADLGGATLIKTQLSQANLRQAKLNESNLTEADLTGAYLHAASLNRANLTKAVLSKGYLHQALLREANLYEADLTKANLSMADLSQAMLARATFTRANLRQVRLSGADLSRAYLSNCNLTQGKLSRANLIRANLYQAKLIGAELFEANLPEAILYQADLRSADLSGASLNRANLTEANLSEAMLVGTDLSEANLTQTNIAGVSSLELKTLDARTENLIFSPANELTLACDDFRLATQLYSLLYGQESPEHLKSQVEAMALLMGSFAPDRAALIHKVKSELNDHGLQPVYWKLQFDQSTDFERRLQILVELSSVVILDLGGHIEYQETLPEILSAVTSTPIIPVIMAPEMDSLPSEILLNLGQVHQLNVLNAPEEFNLADILQAYEESPAARESQPEASEDVPEPPPATEAAPDPVSPTQPEAQVEKEAPAAVETAPRMTEPLEQACDGDQPPAAQIPDEEIPEQADKEDSAAAGEELQDDQIQKVDQAWQALHLEEKMSATADTAPAEPESAVSSSPLPDESEETASAEPVEEITGEDIPDQTAPQQLSPSPEETSEKIGEGRKEHPHRPAAEPESAPEDDNGGPLAGESAADEPPLPEPEALPVTPLPQETKVVIVKDEETEELPAEERPKGSIARIMLRVAIFIGVLSIPVVGYLLWGIIHRPFVLTVHAPGRAYAFLDDKPLLPLTIGDAASTLQLPSAQIGEHNLVVYTSQLEDLPSQPFVRYQTYRRRISIPRGESAFETEIFPETLYTVLKIGPGVQPDIDAAGEQISYLLPGATWPRQSTDRELHLYNLSDRRDTAIMMRPRSLQRQAWGNPVMAPTGSPLYLSVQQNGGSAIYRIDPNSSSASRTTIRGDKVAEQMICLADSSLIIGTTLYRPDGSYVELTASAGAFEERIFPDGNDGILFFELEKIPGSRTQQLTCYQLSPPTSSQKHKRFSLLTTRLPFATGIAGGRRIILTEYSGLSREFYSTISLQEDSIIVPLTPPFLEGIDSTGQRSRFPKIAASADANGRHIVFSYRGEIYLIEFKRPPRAADILDATLPREWQRYSSRLAKAVR